MYKINFNQPIHVHFIGIGGISMSGLAEILLKEGFTVSGSDSKVSPLTEHLEAKGAQIFYGQKASNIIDGIDCVVYTAAIRRENAELMEAVAKKIPMLTRAELAWTAEWLNYKTPIAVSGNSWQRTTTTSMISHVLLQVPRILPSLWAGFCRPSAEISGSEAPASSSQRPVNIQTASCTFSRRSASS